MIRFSWSFLKRETELSSYYDRCVLVIMDRANTIIRKHSWSFMLYLKVSRCSKKIAHISIDSRRKGLPWMHQRVIYAVSSSSECSSPKISKFHSRANNKAYETTTGVSPESTKSYPPLFVRTMVSWIQVMRKVIGGSKKEVRRGCKHILDYLSHSSWRPSN